MYCIFQLPPFGIKQRYTVLPNATFVLTIEKLYKKNIKFQVRYIQKLWIRICIKIFGWTRIRIRIADYPYK